MQPSTPTGGLSIIIHLSITVVVFLYKKISGVARSLFPLPTVSLLTPRIVAKAPPTFFRRMLGYSVVVFVVGGTSSSIVVLAKLFI